MRGAPLPGIAAAAGIRIIPADAGSTAEERKPRRTTPDHPRGCREHSRRIFKAFEQMGSSPRMRGALAVQQVQVAQRGIIPADAGSTAV